MNVIQTEFNGVLYRSRTEARWAVFMNHMGLEFEYETEGFDLGEHGWYIPDFWLPSVGKFLEVKSSIPIPGRASPTGALCAHTKIDVVTFYGPPKPPDNSDGYSESGWLDCWIKEHAWSHAGKEHISEARVGQDNPYWFCCCPHCKRVGIEFDGRSDRIGCKCPKSPHGDKGYNSDDPILLKAYNASANAFRFKPRTRQ